MRNNKISSTFIIAAAFGILGGIAGALTAGAYFYKSALGLPLFGEYRISENQMAGANLIIRDPKKVVVEQSERIFDLRSAAKPSLFGIFKKIATSSPEASAKGKVLPSYYDLTEPAMQAVAATSDGWLIILPPPGLKPEELKNGYVAIGTDKTPRSFQGIFEDKQSGIFFAKIDAENIPVFPFSDLERKNPGTQIAALGLNGNIFQFTLAGTEESGGPIHDSAKPQREAVFSSSAPKSPTGWFLFSISGELVGMIGQTGKTIEVMGLKQALSGILKNKKIAHPDIGISYLLLNETAGLAENKGALLYSESGNTAVKPGSPAQKAGMKEGDILLELNYLEINSENRPEEIIRGQLPGDELPAKVKRGGQTIQLDLKL
jgi:hypothetical protein